MAMKWCVRERERGAERYLSTVKLTLLLHTSLSIYDLIIDDWLIDYERVASDCGFKLIIIFLL